MMALLFAMLLTGRQYHQIDIATFAAVGTPYPYACTTGVVTLKKREADGDDHLRISAPNGTFIVAELIPEMRFPLPALHVRVTVCGVARYDGEHQWWEIHPVLIPIQAS